LHSRPVFVLTTCEHGGNRIPAAYRRWFRGCSRLIASHRGYDPGALAMARTLSRVFSAPLIVSTVSRLVVELNRSPGHRGLFSAAMRRAPSTERDEALQRFYRPYRKAVRDAVERQIERGYRVLHVSSHSFTPILDDVLRRADIGLLYDPSRAFERDVVASWQRELRSGLPGFVVRRNYPYRGTDDGLTTMLRRHFADDSYAGIELEINQKHLREGSRERSALRNSVAQALRSALAEA
jgi:predicted N-formylglutamate amidohydrolase